MDKPSQIIKFQELKREFDRIERELKSQRPEILKILEEFGGWDDISISKASRMEYDDVRILDWAISEYPFYKERICKSVLDWEEFESLCKLGHINIMNMPKNCYRETIITRIVGGKRNEDKT